MSHLIPADGLPILQTQFNVTPGEMNQWTDQEQSLFLRVVDAHLADVGHDTRKALATVIETIRRKHGMPE